MAGRSARVPVLDPDASAGAGAWLLPVGMAAGVLIFVEGRLVAANETSLGFGLTKVLGAHKQRRVCERL